jgi:hypothetical protein
MSRLMRTATTKIVLALTVVLLGTAGVLAGLVGKSGAAATIDHQLCYTATGTGFRVPTSVTLVNQFSTAGFKPKITTVVLHCNPVQKTNLATGQVFPITNPSAHLACLRLTAPTQPTQTVIVSNQFGTATLVPSQPNMFCLPSWKSLTGPPRKTPKQPPGLDHFTCYPVTVTSGTYNPPPVLLQDQFSPGRQIQVQVNPVPQELCLPTQKKVGTHVYKIINPTMHLLCFPVTSTPIRTPVWDQNQFGTAKLAIRATLGLCLPSTKQIGGGG